MGTTGTPLLETVGEYWRGINLWTYWVVPLQFFVQVPWFKVFGFSLLSARLFALTWGFVGLISWAFIVRRFTGNAIMGFWTFLLMASDYQFVSKVALDRMDAMSLAMAALAILAYLELREHNLTTGLVVSQVCVAACGLTHPMPGIPAFCAVAFLVLYYDRARISWRLLVLAAVPYLVFAVGWLWYISVAPDLFRAQFFGNVTDVDRLGGFGHPLGAVIGEFRRHLGMGGFEPGLSALYRIKAIPLVVCLFAGFDLLLDRKARLNPSIRPVLGLWLVYITVITFYDNTKEVKYAVHLVPIYDALVAIWLVRLWGSRPTKRWIAIAGATLFLLVNIFGLIYTIVKDDYHKQYVPVADFLRNHAKAGDLILADSTFGFALGFDGNIVDDRAFTYLSHKTPKFIVVTPKYQKFIEADRVRFPSMYTFIQNLFTRHYEEVFSNKDYRVLRARK